jgi:uncharacterized protein with GYD domain
MALFMIQDAFTPQAWAAMAKNPVDRREAARELATKFGCTLRDYYFCFGESDVVVIFEAPDAATAAAVAIASNMAGHLKAIRTTQLFTVEEAVEIMRKAGAAGPIRAPSS